MEENQVECDMCGSTELVEYCLGCGNAFCVKHIHVILSTSELISNKFYCEDCFRFGLQQVEVEKIKNGH